VQRCCIDESLIQSSCWVLSDTRKSIIMAPPWHSSRLDQQSGAYNSVVTLSLKT
jgi:hypothetical protein